MKKCFSLLFMLLLVLFHPAYVHAESEEWTCPECGSVVSGNFCNICGTEKPSTEWVCPNCGETVEGNFCNYCGAKRDMEKETVTETEPEMETENPFDVNLIPKAETEVTDEADNRASEEVWDWHNNLLKEEHGAKGKLKADGSTPDPEEKVFGVQAWDRNQIKAVYVLDTLENTPENAVDLSAEQNGSVMGWLDQKQALYIAGNGGVMAPANSDALFAWMENVRVIDLGGNLHTDQTTRMGFFFYHCTNLHTVNLDGIDTGKVTTFTKMFTGCHSLMQIDLSGFNTQNAEDMFCMFQNCYALEELDLSSFNPSHVTDFQWMFRACSNLKEIIWDPFFFSTASAENMIGMFLDCSSLESVKVSLFDTSHVTNMYMMFSGCSALKYIDVSHWDVGRVEKHGDMFAGAYLESVYGTNGELVFS